MRKVSVFSLMILMIAGCGPRPAGQTRSAPTQPPASATPATAATDSLTPTNTTVAIILPDRTGTPFAFPRVGAPPPICDNAPPTFMIVHERGQVTDDDPQPLNVRDAPGLSGEIITVLHERDIFYVTDGPRCADDYTWFRIRSGGTEGWIAEGEFGLYYVAPYLP